MQWRFLNCKIEDAMVAAKPKVRTRVPCSRGVVGCTRGGCGGSRVVEWEHPAVWKGGVEKGGQGHGLVVGGRVGVCVV